MKGARTITFIVLVAAQVVICNFVNTGPRLVLSVLPSLILALSIRYSAIRTMATALLVGLAVDFFTTGVLGLSAIPLVAVAFCREWLTRLVFGSDVYARQEEVSERKQGAAKLLIGLLLANILYFIIFAWIEAAGTRPFAFCAVRAALSSLAGTVAGFFALRLLNSVEDARWK